MLIDYDKIYLKLCFGDEQEFKTLQALHRAAMKDAVEKSIGIWDDEVQQARLLKNFEKSFKSLSFIVYDNKLIGSINLRDELFRDATKPIAYVEHFYLYPEYQGYGIGSWLLKKHVPQQCRLSHLKNDEKAANFYLKNGFTVYTEDEYQKYVERL